MSQLQDTSVHFIALGFPCVLSHRRVRLATDMGSVGLGNKSVLVEWRTSRIWAEQERRYTSECGQMPLVLRKLNDFEGTEDGGKSGRPNVTDCPSGDLQDARSGNSV